MNIPDGEVVVGLEGEGTLGNGRREGATGEEGKEKGRVLELHLEIYGSSLLRDQIRMIDEL